MSRPGDFVRRTATRFCSERMRRRLIDPAVADLQAEVADARRSGSARRVTRALIAGYISLAKVLVIAVCGDLRASATAWDHHDAARTRVGMAVALVVTLAATALLELPFFVLLESDLGVGGLIRMAAYLAPSALPLSVPLGLSIATAWLLHGRTRTRKVATAALLTGLLTSAVMFANLGWVAPDANQAFREAAWAHSHPNTPAPVRGDGELRFWDLRARLEQARNSGRVDDVRHLETLYYLKLSASVAPFSVVALVVALAFRRIWTRAGLIATGCLVFAAFYTLFTHAFPMAERGVVQPVTLVWAFNGLCAAAVIAIICWRSRAGRPA